MRLNNDIIEDELDKHRERLESLIYLSQHLDDLVQKDVEFAKSLIAQFTEVGGLSPKQWHWVERLQARIVGAEPIYGNFNPIYVMFTMAGDRLKRPRIRLLTKEETYVELRFIPGSDRIDVYRDGWQGHGHRRFCGWIHSNKIIPYAAGRMTDDIRLLIQEFSLDPQGVSRAMANRLGACMYCGQRLSDQESKHRGYGPVCADNYGLPWGNQVPRTHRVNLPEDLSDLFTAH